MQRGRFREENNNGFYDDSLWIEFRHTQNLRLCLEKQAVEKEAVFMRSAVTYCKQGLVEVTYERQTLSKASRQVTSFS
jgi:hypothetical protein